MMTLAELRVGRWLIAGWALFVCGVLLSLWRAR